MAVLMTALLPGATQEMIDGMAPVLDSLPGQKGFVVHTNGPVPDGWRVVEVWDSQADSRHGSRRTSSPRFPRAPRGLRSRSMS
jgi:hypothetical protein